MNLTKICLVVAAVAITAGCVGRNAANSGRGIRAGINANGSATPEVTDICNVSSLESERDQYIRQTVNLRQQVTGDARGQSSGDNGASSARSGDAEAAATGNTSTDSQVGGSTTFNGNSMAEGRLISRINRFDAEIDAKYRSVIASCRAFSRCMQNNFYDEGQCRSTLTRWENADRDLSDLARELREIDAEVENIRNVARRGGRGYRVNPRDRSVGGYDY